LSDNLLRGCGEVNAAISLSRSDSSVGGVTHWQNPTPQHLVLGYTSFHPTYKLICKLCSSSKKSRSMDIFSAANIFGTLASGVLGILTGQAVEFINRRRILPFFYIAEHPERTGSEFYDVREITYFKILESKEISVTEIAIWNEGREVIRGNEINPKNLLRCVCLKPLKDNFISGEIFDIYLKSETDYPNNGFEFERKKFCKDRYYINFVEIKSKEGAVLRVFHEPHSKIKIYGAIIGFGNVKEKVLRNVQLSRLRWKIRIFILFMLYVIAFYLTLAIFAMPPHLMQGGRFESFFEGILYFLGRFVFFGFPFVFGLGIVFKILPRTQNIPINIKSHFFLD
jgi:hypothetical protein